jgi:HPt (histidine-containing phosphotransfer) domain-containing protein
MTERFNVEVDADLKDLIPNFLTNRNKEVRDLAAALEKNDFEALRLIGHNMKGVGGGYGFGGITELGLEVEKAAKQQDLLEVRACLERYQSYLQHVDVVFV